MRRRLKINRYCAGVRETCSKYTEESAEAAPGTSTPSRTQYLNPFTNPPPPPPVTKAAPGAPPRGRGPTCRAPRAQGASARPQPPPRGRLQAGDSAGKPPRAAPRAQVQGGGHPTAAPHRSPGTAEGASAAPRPSPALRSPTSASPSDQPAGRGGKEEAAAKRAGRRLKSGAFPPAAGDHPAAIAGAAAASGSGAFVTPPPAAERCWGGSPGCSCFAFLRLLPLAVICISPALIDMRLSAAASPRRSLQRAAPPSPPLPPSPLAGRCGATATALPAAALRPFLPARRLPHPSGRWRGPGPESEDACRCFY